MRMPRRNSFTKAIDVEIRADCTIGYLAMTSVRQRHRRLAACRTRGLRRHCHLGLCLSCDGGHADVEGRVAAIV